MPSLAELGLEADESDVGQERSVLEAIYPEINFLSSTQMELRIEIDDDEATTSEQDVEEQAVENKAVYGDEWSDECPYIVVRFELPSDKDHLIDEVPEVTVVESVPSSVLSHHSIVSALSPPEITSSGEPMIFDLIELAKDQARQLLIKARLQYRANMAEKVAEKQMVAQKEHDMKFGGTAVTPASFLTWWDRFVVEMAEQNKTAGVEDEKIKDEDGSRSKLTGRQLWERGLAGRVDVEDGGQTV